MSDPESNLHLEIGHVLFIDIVGYSKLLIEEQRERLNQLTAIVLATAQVRESPDERLVRLPTGDGMALVFHHSAEEPACCALEIAEALRKHPELPVRMGIHSGPVSEVTDVSGRSNIAGAGINMAQRVMDCGDAGHILLSQHVADDLMQYRQWAPRLRDLGDCEVKHGVRLHLVNLYAEPLGNPESPQKFRAATSVRQPRSTKWTVYAAAAAAVIITAAIPLPRVLRAPKAAVAVAPVLAPEKSIAVLPFENLSDEKSNAYFADGIQDEILTRLSKVAALKVISRTSTEKYKTAPENLREVGRQLGVANILEGSVQKIANAVHVNVQLIRVATDEHLWAESYNRKLDDVFTVEGEVAGAIADALNAKLTGAEKAVLARRPTENAAAYDAYLRGTAQYRGLFTQQEQEGAVRSFEEATRLDPQFAEAWAALSRSHSLLCFHSDITASRRAAAESALAEATRLRPDLLETQLARAYFQYWALLDYKGALEVFRQLRTSWPGNAEIHRVVAFISARLGLWQDSIESIDRAIALDPRDLYTRIQAISLLFATRDFQRVLQSAESALQIWPDNTNLRGLKAFAFQSLGQLDNAQAALDGIVPQTDAPDASLGAIFSQAQLTRDPTAAIHLLEPLAHRAEAESGPFPLWLLEWADLQLRAGKTAEGRALFARGRDDLQNQVQQQPRNGELQGVLAVVLSELGDGAAALRALDKSAELQAGDARAESVLEDARAHLLARAGDKDGAIATLQRVLSRPSDATPPLTPALLRLDPDFDSLRGDPRFEKLCQEKQP